MSRGALMSRHIKEAYFKRNILFSYVFLDFYLDIFNIIYSKKEAHICTKRRNSRT